MFKIQGMPKFKARSCDILISLTFDLTLINTPSRYFLFEPSLNQKNTVRKYGSRTIAPNPNPNPNSNWEQFSSGAIV